MLSIKEIWRSINRLRAEGPSLMIFKSSGEKIITHNSPINSDVFIIGVLWDTFAIWRGHWVFPAGNNLGIVIGLMPIEEYLFILVLPYFILTIYKIIDSKFKKSIK